MLRAYLSEERAEELKKFWATGQPIRILADRWGCTISYISIKAKEIGLPSRHVVGSFRKARGIRRPVVAIDNQLYFNAEAAKRHLHPRELESLIIMIVSNDRMVDAILDDEAYAKSA